MIDGGWSGRTERACASTPGATGQFLTAIAPYAGNDVRYRVDCAVAYLREMQRADGGWASDGESTVRDTSQAVSGLLAAGVPRDDKTVVAAIHWLLVYQRPDGGWGADGAPREASQDSHSDDCAASAAQTAWGVIALVAAGRANDAATRRAVQFLLDTQQPDGDWAEGYSTRTLPTKDGIRPNNIEATAWPLIALSQWAVAAAALQDAPAGPPALRLVAAAAED
jgi:squalene-hopene/tetraprenyl-beta-curcumene cyclase